ncbi:hypothetical protein BDQ17DRAFT_1332736 [Cyathus striatus]|nr:hypothetical protein BDQ17DRAFT_1332736 [Cyathus striatus]
MVHKVIEDHFFSLLEWFYWDCSTVDYSSKGSSCYHWNVGEELTLRTCKWVWGVANIGNHWVVIGIDSTQNNILYGDLLADPDSDIHEDESVLLDALNWWTTMHMSKKYMHSHLPITHQNDPFSCVSLLEESEVITEWICTFIHIAQQDIDTSSDSLPNIPLLSPASPPLKKHKHEDKDRPYDIRVYFVTNHEAEQIEADRK